MNIYIYPVKPVLLGDCDKKYIKPTVIRGQPAKKVHIVSNVN